MNIGRLRHRITIEQLTQTPDGAGGYTEAWTTFATVWSSVDPIGGKEYFAAKQVQSEATHKIRLRYRVGITPDMRINFGGRLFGIESVINWEERNRELILMCSEVTPSAN